MEGDKFVSSSPDETRAFAASLAQNIIHTPKRGSGAYIVALEGVLGAGKTSFTQGFAKGLGIRENITSPTFVIVKKFPINSPDFRNFFHIDMYRVKEEKEIESLELDKIFTDPSNLIILEWPRRVASILPKSTLWIRFDFGKSDNERVINVTRG